MRTNSEKLFDEAKYYIPGGVNSPVRAFTSVGGHPRFMKSGNGAILLDEDGNQYVDFINSWGPMILGHAHPEVVHSVMEQVANSFTYGTPTEVEVKMAKMICELVPSIDQIRMVNSGTEACMSAVRLARGYTGRPKIIKFEGCYHGHFDSFLIKAGSGVGSLSESSSAGVNASVAADTLLAKFNDLCSVEELVNKWDSEIACIIVEPVAGNMGCIPPKDGFLEGLRKICDQNDILLIFDEVMTGFRLALGGAQEMFGVTADLVCYGKVIGGGFPVAAFGGRREIMKHLAPEGQVYQAGTLSGNPVSMAAGLTTLRILKENPKIYQDILDHSDIILQKLNRLFKIHKMPVRINQVGSMFSIFFTDQDVVDFDTAKLSDDATFKSFFHHLLDNGIYIPPSKYETWFVSGSVGMEHIKQLVEVAKEWLERNSSPGPFS